MNINIIKSDKYKEILCECLNINEKKIKSPNYLDIIDIKEILFERVLYDKEFNVILNEFSIDYGIFLKTEFIFFIDEVFIGVFDNKYIVSMRESDISFIFSGTNESNWLEESFSWGHNFSDLFMLECFKVFGIPIKKFDRSFLNEQFIYSFSYKK